MNEEEKDLINLKISISPEKYIKELLQENQKHKKVIDKIKGWKTDRQMELSCLQSHNSYVIDGNTIKELEDILKEVK